MDCNEVRDQLSAFYDGELSNETSDSVARHLAECAACSKILEGFRRVTGSLQESHVPEVPPAIWERLSAEMDQGNVLHPPLPHDHVTAPASCPERGLARRLTPLAIAASIALVVGSGYWIMNRPQDGEMAVNHHGAEFTVAMDHYLETLASDPDRAEQFLLNKYAGQRVDASGAARLVGYRPAIANGLPDGYSLTSTSVLDMPCCRCVKAVCKREDGSTLVLFEHDDDETQWLAERPSSMAMCGDTECCLTELDVNIAATWRRGTRSVTAVGVRDPEEVATLVEWLDRQPEAT